MRLKARWDFPGEQSDDLPLRKGEVIALVARHDSGWWRVRALAPGAKCAACACVRVCVQAGFAVHYVGVAELAAVLLSCAPTPPGCSRPTGTRPATGVRACTDGLRVACCTQGRNDAGREGNFPSNYVKELPPPLPARRSSGDSGSGGKAAPGVGGGKEDDGAAGDRASRRGSVRLRCVSGVVVCRV